LLVTEEEKKITNNTNNVQLWFPFAEWNVEQYKTLEWQYVLEVLVNVD
jgi:hypothetical protein